MVGGADRVYLRREQRVRHGRIPMGREDRGVHLHHHAAGRAHRLGLQVGTHTK